MAAKKKHRRNPSIVAMENPYAGPTTDWWPPSPHGPMPSSGMQNPRVFGFDAITLLVIGLIVMGKMGK